MNTSRYNQTSDLSLDSALVSVIIPAYNVAPYIHRAIESSLSQTHKNTEVLVIDDGSTDDTLSIARSYAEKDSRVRILTQENLGVSAARNNGISEARGEYLYFLDSDDWLEPDALEVMLDTQAANPDRLVGVNSWHVYFDGNSRDIFLRTKSYNVPSRIMTAAETIYAQNERTFPPTSCAKIFSADIIRRHSLTFREGIHYGEDQIFALEYLIRTAGSVYVEKPLFSILMRQGSLMRPGTSGRKWQNKEDWYMLILNLPDITPEIREALKVYAGKACIGDISSAVHGKKDSGYIHMRREKARLFMRDILFSKRISSVRKLWSICLVYFPIVIVKLAVSLRKSLKPDVRNTKKEAIPYW
ncbi:MAG: glycosyltransferase family 2 protein [Synergistaceae bacterium]|nr:glycosyltransferase family 2 protein [Synergistaceae bacterium]